MAFLREFYDIIVHIWKNRLVSNGPFNSFRHPPTPGPNGAIRKKIVLGVGNSTAYDDPPGNSVCELTVCAGNSGINFPQVY